MKGRQVRGTDMNHIIFICLCNQVYLLIFAEPVARVINEKVGQRDKDIRRKRSRWVSPKCKRRLLGAYRKPIIFFMYSEIWIILYIILLYFNNYQFIQIRKRSVNFRWFIQGYCFFPHLFKLVCQVWRGVYRTY